MLTQKDDSIILSSVYSSLAQLVEHAAVNRRVVGSSPTGGASAEALNLNGFRAFSFFKTSRNLHVSNVLSNTPELKFRE